MRDLVDRLRDIRRLRNLIDRLGNTVRGLGLKHWLSITRFYIIRNFVLNSCGIDTLFLKNQ